MRDGFKPVHRRIVFAMNDMGLGPSAQHRKSARVVGEVLGKYHPHGDQSVYDALARMAQDFSLREVLVDGQGNFGSVDGDSPGAMRCAECRLSAVGGEMLRDFTWIRWTGRIALTTRFTSRLCSRPGSPTSWSTVPQVSP